MPIEEGGIGFLNSRDIHSVVARIASFFGFSDHRQAFLNMLAEPRHIDVIQQDFGVFTTRPNLKTYLKCSEEAWLSEVLVMLDKVKSKSIKDKSTFQNALYLLKNEDRRLDMDERLKASDHSLIKVISYRNTVNQNAGAWLKAHGTYAELKLSYWSLSV